MAPLTRRVLEVSENEVIVKLTRSEGKALLERLSLFAGTRKSITCREAEQKLRSALFENG
jgi:hypothetical protein